MYNAPWVGTRLQGVDREKVEQDRVKGYNYLLELESQGYVDDMLFHHIGLCYSHGYGCPGSSSTAVEYYQRAANMDYVPAIMEGHRWMKDMEFAAFLWEAEAKGLQDDRILASLIKTVWSLEGTPSSEGLGDYKDKSEMALHYCDVLIKRRSSKGYKLKGEIYWYGKGGVDKDESKAVAIWEEAHKLELADYGIYYQHNNPTYGLIEAYA